MGNNVAELKLNITNEQVDYAIASFKLALVASKETAQSTAVLCLQHCYQHRTAAKLRELLNLIETDGKDFVRRAPFTLWLAAYAPVHMVSKEVDGKKARVLEFNKESKLLDNAAWYISEATAKLWWTMSQDKEVGAFDLLSFDKRVLGIAKKALAEIDASTDEISANVRAHVAGIVSQFEKAVAADKAAVAKIAVGGARQAPAKAAA